MCNLKLLFWTATILFFSSNACIAQAVEIKDVQAFMEAQIDKRTGRFLVGDQAKYIARLYVEVVGDVEQVATVEVKLDKLSRDFATTANVLDRKISFDLTRQQPTGFDMKKGTNAILIGLGEYTTQELFNAQVVIEDKQGKKSKMALYKAFKN